MFDCIAYTGEKIVEKVDRQRLEELLRDEKSLVWLNIESPTDEDMIILDEFFGFHPLCLEDCMTRGQRSKLEDYHDYLFIVIYSLYYDQVEKEVAGNELHFFLGKNYVVSVHDTPIPALKTSQLRWKQSKDLIKEGPGFLLYNILDAIVDNYFPLLDVAEERIEQIEDRMLEGESQVSSKVIFVLKKDLLTMRKVVSPQRDIFNSLMRCEGPVFTPQVLLHLRDVYDHLLRVQDTISLYREMATSAMELYQIVISNRMNAVMKTLTVAATILMSVAVVTGIYGMNFQYMPELKWPWGYPLALTLMVLLGTVLLLFFRKRKWL